MGNGVRQCEHCGWTCYGSKWEMKSHKKKHRAQERAERKEAARSAAPEPSPLQRASAACAAHLAECAPCAAALEEDEDAPPSCESGQRIHDAWRAELEKWEREGEGLLKMFGALPPLEIHSHTRPAR